MKTSKLVVVAFLFCLSIKALGQTDSINTVSKADYNFLLSELKKVENLNELLEAQYKQATALSEESNGKNSELNAYIGKQKVEIEKLKIELAKCKSRKKQ